MTHLQNLPWTGIDTVLLDMDGTLLDLRYDTVFWQEYLPERYAAHHAVTRDTAQTTIGELMRSARPRLDYYCFEWWSRATGLDIASLKPDLAHLIAWRDGAEAFIGGVRASGRRAIIVTNAHPSGIALKHSITGIADLVDALEHAHDHDHPKEHARFWERVHERLAFDPARTLLVDDNLEVLASAERFGIAHLRAVARPDSGRPPLRDLPYPAVHAFAELLAELTAATEGDADERS
jgi:putative hydrolase of the HAD superfamily